MQAHRLALEEVAQQPFKLIAIHSHIEEYKLAFILNKNLNLRLTRTRTDVDLHTKSGQSFFSLYAYKDLLHYCTYYLVSNRSNSRGTTTAVENTLFENEFTLTPAHLLPELKKVDFFLKVEGETEAILKKPYLRYLNSIPQISTAYGIDKSQIKSEENLIFD
ncbi:MAG TPA: IPExxxVDY family protein [Salinimicrobium sp.]|nr:IPExxxVDY family protein [Salinimicrobium sp.]